MFALFGWGGFGGGMFGGFGGGGNFGTQAIEAAVQRGFDTQTVVSKLDGISNGICSLGYDQLAQMNNIGQSITTTGYNIERAIQADTVANMQNQFALSRQVDQCCCNTQNLIQQLKYDMATGNCSIETLVNQVAQQLGWSQQAGFRDLADLINDRFNQLTIAQKDAVIAELTAKLNNCDRDNALQSLGTYLINTLQPRSVPCYPAANPNYYGNWSTNVLSGGNWGNQCCGNVA